MNFSAKILYNFCIFITNNSSSYSTARTIAMDSICPKGWRLPTTISNEFGVLLAAQNILDSSSDTSYSIDGFNLIRHQPLYFSRSCYIDAVLIESGNNGYYWSNTVDSSINAYLLRFNKSNAWPIHDADWLLRKFAGRSIRCLAR